MKKEIPDLNLFMMCEKLNKNACKELPEGFFVRSLKKEELEIWKRIPFDDEKTANEYYNFMTDYFNNNYSQNEKEFFKKCKVVVDKNDKIVATCFVWKVYDKINTIHWLKVVKNYEGLGIGKALLTIVMKDLNEKDYPVFLHTQPGSFRAIKLYTDFGFCLLTNEYIGNRQNHLKESLPYLKENMIKNYFENLKFKEAPKYFLDIVKISTLERF
jgi:ribosomal protein S18 acetylase RimI-like enzyme